MSSGYNGLPAYYVESSDPITPNLGLSLKGMDPVLALDMVLIDDFAGGGGGTSVFVNSVSVANPNFNNATPAAPPGFTNVIWQVSGSNVSAYAQAATPGGPDTAVQFNNAGTLDGSANFTYDGFDLMFTGNATFDGNGSTALQILSTGFTGSTGVVNISALYQDNGSPGNMTGVSIQGGNSSTQDVSSSNLLFIQMLINGTGDVNSTSAIFISTPTAVGGGAFDSCVGLQIGDWSAIPNSFPVSVEGGVSFFQDGFKFVNKTTGPIQKAGTGSPEGVVTATVGSEWLRTDGGAGTTLYLKESGSGNTGWVAVTHSTGSVTSFSAGTLSPLFTTSVANPTTTPALSFALSNAAGGTLFGNNATTSGAPAYTTAPVLGIPGTSTGTIALASSTASGKFTVTAPASSATPTLTLPTTSNVLAGQLAGDNVIYSTTLVVASAAGTLTLPTPQNQTANTVFAGPASGGAASPTFRALVNADVATLVKWSDLQNASGALTLANGTNATTFNQTSAVTWTWANTTVSTSGSVFQNSPIHSFNGTYWDGAASSTDSWTMQLIGGTTAASNNISQLRLVHTGSSGAASFNLPAGATTGPSLVFGTAVNTGGTFGPGMFSGGASILGLHPGSGTGNVALSLRLYRLNSGTATLTSALVTGSGTGGFTLSTQENANALQQIVIASTQGTASGVGIILGGNGGNNSRNFGATSGNSSAVQIGAGAGTGQGAVIFNPTSGTGTFQALVVNPTINQTGGANGTVTSLLVNAVETAVVGTHLLLDLQAGATGGTSEFAINNVGVVTKYAATTTVSQGIPSEIVTVDLTAQTALIAATTLISAPASGMYRISWSATITTAGTTSILGGTNGFQVVYTSPTDSVVKTTVPGNSTTSAANTTGTAVGGSIVVYAKTGTNIQYAFDYTSTGTAMVYELHIKLERM